jgi:haloacid dehalogenase superfamily, subfamily IA, variant 3 with third motif having DD or ED
MQTHKKLSAIIFDLDGVIIDNTDFHVEAWVAYARKLGRELTADDVKMRLGFSCKEYMRFILNREPTDEEVADSVAGKESLYRDIFRPQMRAPDGLMAFLDAAVNAGIPMGIATGAPQENIDFTLDGLGIRHYFAEVTDSSQVPNCKPAPDTYLLAASRLGVEPARCVVVEDAIAGIQSGKSAGMKVIAITSSYPAEVLRKHSAPDAVIDSFLDLQKPDCAAMAVLREVCGEFSV